MANDEAMLARISNRVRMANDIQANDDDAQTETNDGGRKREYPFHTAVIDGVEVVGVLFDGASGGFYEFQDPATHSDYERYEDPRTGDVLTHDSELQRIMADVMSGRPRATVPADEWLEFREDYVEAESGHLEAWREAWGGLCAADPRTDVSDKQEVL